MAVGTTSDFNVTRDELIDLSLSILGESEPSQDDRTLAVKVLNSLIRSLDVSAKWLHAIDGTRSTLTLIGGTREYSTGVGANNIATNILKLEYAAILKGGDADPPLTIFTKDESLSTPLKDDTNSEPVAVYLERNVLLSDNKMQFFPTPNAADTVVYNYRRPLFDFDLATDNPDIPPGFVLALQKLLAVELAPHFGTTLGERQLLIAEGRQQFKEAVDGYADQPSYEPMKAEYF